jgi:hypothetical protein
MCAPMRPHAGDLRHARGLDARHHAGVRDPDARPILQRLLQRPCGAWGLCRRFQRVLA